MNVMLCGEFPNKKIAGGQLSKVIRKCVELTPSTRYQSIQELQEALADLSGCDTAFKKRAWKKLLPPGFRTNKAVRHIFSAFGYLLIFCFGLTLEVEDAGAAELWLNRVVFTVMCLCIVFFNGNYLGIQRSFVLTRSKYRLVRWLGMVIVDAVLLSFWVILLNAIVGSFIR